MEKAKKKLFDEHLPEFVRQVNPVELLQYLPCLSMSSREEVDRCQHNYGKSMAMQKLHENIVRRPEGWDQLVVGLRKHDMGHLADLIDPDKQSPDKQDEENHHYKRRQEIKQKKQLPSPVKTSTAHVITPGPGVTADTPIEKLNAKVLPILKRLDRDVGQKWDDLAGLLGFSVERVDSITAKNTKSPTWAVIGEWQAQGGATLGNLMSHLIQMERFDVLKELENETGFKLPENKDTLAAYQVEENPPPDFRNGEQNKLEQHHKFTTINFPPGVINPYVANTGITMDKTSDPKVLQTLIQTNGASSPTDDRPVYKSTIKESSGSIGNRNETAGLASPTHDVQRTPLNGGTSNMNRDFVPVQMIRQESQPQDVYTPGVGTCSNDNVSPLKFVNKQADNKQHGDLGACGETAIANAGEANDIGPRVSRVSQAISVQSYPSMGNPHDIHEQNNITNGGHIKQLDSINESKDESSSIDSDFDSKKSDMSCGSSLTSQQDINSLSKEGDSIQRKADKVYHGIKAAVNSGSFSDADLETEATNQLTATGNRPTVVSEEFRRASHENDSRDVEFNNRPTTLSRAQSSSTTDARSMSREMSYTSNDESFELDPKDIPSFSESPTQFMRSFRGVENELIRNSRSNNDHYNRQANEMSSSANEGENNTTVNNNGVSDTAAAGRADLQDMGATARFGSGTLHEKQVMQQKSNFKLLNCAINSSQLPQTTPEDISTAASNGSSATNLNIGTTEQFGSNTLHKHMDNSNQSDLPSDSQRNIGDTQQFGSHTLHEQMKNCDRSDRPTNSQESIGDTEKFGSGTLHLKLETVQPNAANELPNFGDLLMSADNSHVSSETSELANIADVDNVRGEGFVVANGVLPDDLEMRENGLDNQEDQNRQMSLSERIINMIRPTPDSLSVLFNSFMRTNQQ